MARRKRYNRIRRMCVMLMSREPRQDCGEHHDALHVETALLVAVGCSSRDEEFSVLGRDTKHRKSTHILCVVTKQPRSVREHAVFLLSIPLDIEILLVNRATVYPLSSPASLVPLDLR